jgi:hypothetical protein
VFHKKTQTEILMAPKVHPKEETKVFDQNNQEVEEIKEDSHSEGVNVQIEHFEIEDNAFQDKKFD